MDHRTSPDELPGAAGEFRGQNGIPGRFTLRELSAVELRQMIASHGRWVAGEAGERANFSYRRLAPVACELAGPDLRRANLRGADLRRADLRGALLAEADLREADLTGAD